MSWAKVKKINSDLSTPLNIASLINHIDLVGSNYVGIDDPDLSIQLYKSKSLFMHPIAFRVVTGYALSPSQFETQGLTCLCTLAGLDPSDYADTSELIDNETAMTAVINSETAMTAVANSETAMTAVINSETAMTAVANSETAMTAVANSETAMTAVANSETAMTAVFNSAIAKEVLWDSEYASSILMQNASSRTWMLNNVSTSGSVTAFSAGTVWSGVKASKGFALSVRVNATSNVNSMIARTPAQSVSPNTVSVPVSWRLQSLEFGLSIVGTTSKTLYFTYIIMKP